MHAVARFGKLMTNDYHRFLGLPLSPYWAPVTWLDNEKAVRCASHVITFSSEVRIIFD